MSTLEDKILGEKNHNYCSSSEDEDENAKGKFYATSTENAGEPTSLGANKTHFSGGSSNTGPKGVIKDWQRYKMLESEKREEAELERLTLMKKLNISAKTAAEDEKAKEQEELEKEFNELMSDDFLFEFQKKRVAEMLAMNGGLSPMFGNLYHITSPEQMLDAIDTEQKTVTIVLHIYDERTSSCRTLNNCLQSLAEEYKYVKFCKISGAVAGMSIDFKRNGIPAILVYKNKQVIGNFVRISDELGDDFYPSDVESFLVEHAMLPDRLSVPTLTN